MECTSETLFATSASANVVGLKLKLSIPCILQFYDIIALLEVP